MAWDPRTDLYGDPLRTGMVTRFGTTRFRHRGLTGLTMSSDGRFVACGTDEGAVVAWKASTGKRLFKGQAAVGPTVAVAFCPTDRRLAAAGHDGVIRIWDLGSGRLLRLLEGHGDHVYALAWSPDGTHLVSGGGGPKGKRDRWGRIWNVGEGTELAVCKGQRSNVAAVAFSNDGEQVAIAAGKTVRTFDLKGKRQKELKEAAGVHALLYGPSTLLGTAPDGLHRWTSDSHERIDLGAPLVGLGLHGRMVAVGDAHGSIVLYDLERAVEVRRIEADNHPLAHLCFSPDGQVLLALGEQRHSPRLFETLTGKRVIKGDGHEGGVVAVAASEDASRVWTAGRDEQLGRWDAEGRIAGTVAAEASCVATNASGEVVVAGSADRVLLWQDPYDDDVEVGVLPATVSLVALSPDGRDVVAGCEGALRIFRASGEEVASADATPQAVAFAGKTVLVAADGQVKRWNLETGAFLDEVAAPFDLVGPVALSDDGALCAADGKVFDTETGDIVTSFAVDDDITSYAFSPDKKSIAAADAVGRIAIRPLASDDDDEDVDIRVLGGHNEAVRGLVWRGERLLSCSEDCTAAAWSAEG